jgi:hypothetical protein
MRIACTQDIRTSISLSQVCASMMIPSSCPHTHIGTGEQKEVEAIPHDYGLRVGIIYDATNDGNKLLYQRWKVKTSAVLTVTFMNGGDISTFGGKRTISYLSTDLI